ncbi:terminase family protein [Enterobacter kobei]|nr:terminase family protein [Enterobacter kobei]
MAARYSEETKQMAKQLYLKRHTPKEIATKLKLPNVVLVYNWAEKFNWADLLNEETALDAIERRIALLTPRENKKAAELRELECLINSHIKLMAQRNKHTEKMAEIKGRLQPAAEHSDEASEGEQPRRRRRKNDISHITAEALDAWANENLYQHQLHVRKNKSHKVRNILKARQIGMTYYFAFEAFEDAILTGDQQIFLSASKAQAFVFRQYIFSIASQFFDVQLRGTETITLSNGAVLRFLATNSNTAQSHSGNLYCDEYFWIPKFQKMDTVASAMAAQIKRRVTYFSTPSSKSHQAYPMWSGERWKKDRTDRKNIEFPDFEAMRQGVLCPDRQWRHVITLADAIAGGFDLIDIDEQREIHSDTAFNMLFMCIFVDDAASVFKLEALQKCKVDPTTWKDYDSKAARPFGQREVWGGFDPARTGDNATFVVVAVPVFAGERFRLLEKYHWRGLAFAWMAEEIKKIKEKFNMTHIGVDVTGIGAGVFELIQHFARREAMPITYNVAEKNRLVMKMLDIVDSERIEWAEDDHTNASASFMAIRQTTTASGNEMTFVADRTEYTGHADLFFAISHAIIKEPLSYRTKRKSSWGIAA